MAALERIAYGKTLWVFQANNVLGFIYPPSLFIFHCVEVTLHVVQGSVRLQGKARRYF